MSDEEKKFIELVEEGVNNIIDIISGLSAPIRKNALKALTQLCTVAADISTAKMEGVAAEIRAETKMRVKFIEIQTDMIASSMNVEHEYAKAAIRKHGQKIIREQSNLDAIAKIAIKELSDSEQVKNNDSQIPDISQDWLNTFEKEAGDKSSDDMKYLFGKILAGEIRKPSSYSIRTVKILSQIDVKTAKLFHILSSLTSTMLRMDLDGSHIIDSRVISLGGNANSNSLKAYKLDFSALNIMQEYGLIIADYNSWMDYQYCAFNDKNQLNYVFKFQGKTFALERTDTNKPISEFKIHGVGLTTVGKELLGIIDIQPNEQYAIKLFEFFAKNGFKCIDLHNPTR